MNKAILTLPKSGTHLWYNILKFLIELDYLVEENYPYFGHILDQNNRLLLNHDQVAFIAVRDVRGFFLSLCNWCDVECQKILEDKSEIPGMLSERAPVWKTMTFEEKLESLVDQTDKSLCDITFIDANFQAAGYLVTMGVPAFKFEDIASLNAFSEPSDKAIETCIRALSYIGLSLNADVTSEVMRLSWGGSVTFNSQGGPDKWKSELPSEIRRNIEVKYSRHLHKLGYEI